MIGEVKGSWTVIETAGKNTRGDQLWKCRCVCGHEAIKKTSVLNHIHINKGCRFCKQGSREEEENRLVEELVGKQFGSWIVIAFAGKTKYKSRLWKCRCKCGSERCFPTTCLSETAKRKATICKRCELANLEQSNRITNDIPKRFWDKFNHVAERRGITVEITKEQALAQFNEQNKKCALTGLPLYFTKLRTNYSRYTTASLDRIDSSKPYTKENIQWLDKRINMMKNTHGQEEFVTLCKLVASHNEKPS